MHPEKPISSKMRTLLDAEKLNARERIIERGIVHFRGDKEFMKALFITADKLKIAPGTLCRQIVWEYLKTAGSVPAANVNLTNKEPSRANVLVAKLELLERTVREIQSYLMKDSFSKSKKRSI